MKMIIAVTFLGILGHAFAQGCELMPADNDLDLNKYFSIPHVYVTHSRELPKETVCREYRTTKSGGDTTKTVITSDYTTGGKQQHTELTCINKPITGNKGQYTSECQGKGAGGGTNNVNIQISVFATDNEKYALLQTCTKTTEGFKYNILVLQTNKEGVEEEVKTKLKSINWDIDQWYSRKNVDCNVIK